MADFFQFVVAGLTQGSIYALVGVGFHIIYSATKVINFAQGDQVVLGGLIALMLLQTVGLPLAIAIIGAVLIGAVIGLAYERFALRPTYKNGELATIVATIGASILLFHGSGLIWGRTSKPFPVFSGQPNEVINLFNVKILVQSLWVYGLLIIALLALYYFFGKTIEGQAIRAASYNEIAAKLVGISVERSRAYSLALAAGLAALAGVMMAPITLAGGAIGVPIAIKGFAGAIVGGIDKTGGAVAGGLIVGVVEAFAAGFLSSGLRDPAVFALLLLALLVRPDGIFGTKTISKV